MPTSLHVLHVAETAQGGVGSYLDELIALQQRRYGVSAVRAVLPDQHAAQVAQLSPAQQRHYRVGSGRMGNVVRLAWMTMCEVVARRPAVVHLHSTYAGLALRPLLACLGPRRPRVIYCAHGWAFDRNTGTLTTRWIMAVERVLSRFGDAIVCISRHDLNSALRAGIDGTRLLCVMNGIRDAAPPSGDAAAAWPPQRLRVLFVGRLDRQKGVDLLFEAMRRLDGRAHAVVAGASVVGGSQSPGVLPPNVQTTGWLDRQAIARLCAQAQVLAVPSRWEGFGLVALEAMRAGVAVVAARVGGLPEVVDDGLTGCLFPPDDVDGLVAALEALAEPGQPEAMGEAGRRRYQELFTAARMEAQIDALYRRVLDRASLACNAAGS